MQLLLEYVKAQLQQHECSMADEEMNAEVRMAKKEKPMQRLQPEPTAKLAIVRVRGAVRASEDIHRTFAHLNLPNANACSIVPATPSMLGMVRKVKDFVTWGEVDEALAKALFEKYGEQYGDLMAGKARLYTHKYIEMSGKRYKPTLRLNPPRKGYGRKGVKVAFAAGGALGYRGEKISELLKRMM